MKTPNIKIPEKDMAEIMAVADKIANHTNEFQAKTVKRAEQIENRVSVVEKKVSELEKKP
ncbi:MAG: hypothetical protein Q7S86_02720 [bacterium]|nr:hypothetical protein [bacterium]